LVIFSNSTNQQPKIIHSCMQKCGEKRESARLLQRWGGNRLPRSPVVHSAGATTVVVDSARAMIISERPFQTQYANVKEFICLRENPTSSLIFKDITANLIRKLHNHFTLGQIGRLQLLLPFLQKDLVTDYSKKIVDTLHDKHCWNNELLWLHMEMVTGNSCEDKRLILIESFEVAIISTFKSWGNEIDYISPHVFLTLLEKLFFFSSSCEYLLGGLFLPRSFFVEFMTGEQGNSSCAWLLQSKHQLRCQGRLEKFYGPVCDVVWQLLVTSKSETFSWIKMSKIDSRTYFPEMALHFIIMLYLIGVKNTGLYEHAMQVLLTIFRDKHIKKNPPPKFKGKLLQIFQKHYPNRYTFFMHFSLLVRDIDNPLVTIDLATHPELDGRHEDFIVLRQESIESKELLLQNIFQDKGDMFVSNGRERDTKSKELLVHGEKHMGPSNNNSYVASTEHIEENVSDNAECLRDKPEKEIVLYKPILDCGNIDQQKKGDYSEVEACSRDETNQISLVVDIKPSYMFEVNGQCVPWFVQRRMKKWLSCARRSLEETLSVKDKYIREACRVFQGSKNSSYTKTFISKACLLKVEVDELLDLITITILKVKQGKVCVDEESEILEEMHDIHEDLMHLSELLCPMHKKHEECDTEWLENDAIGHTSIRLQECRHRLDRFKSVFEDDTRTVTECIQPVQSNKNLACSTFILYDPDGNKKAEKGTIVGNATTTHNHAKYQALIFGLEEANCLEDMTTLSMRTSLHFTTATEIDTHSRL
ncbi:hypothetical protein KI387_001166, partial [Taxus chinensis]